MEMFDMIVEKYSPILKSIREKPEGSEYVPGTLMHWKDILVGWLPNLGEQASDAFYDSEQAEVAANRIRSSEFNRLLEGGSAPTPAGERARQLPKYIDALEKSAKARAKHYRIKTYREDVIAAINVLKAELKASSSEWPNT